MRTSMSEIDSSYAKAVPIFIANLMIGLDAYHPRSNNRRLSFWGLLAFTPYLLAHGWPASVAIPFVTLIDLPCGLSAFYLVDLLNSHYRKNNEFLRRFYAELHADLLVLLFFQPYFCDLQPGQYKLLLVEHRYCMLGHTLVYLCN